MNKFDYTHKHSALKIMKWRLSDHPCLYAFG